MEIKPYPLGDGALASSSHTSAPSRPAPSASSASTSQRQMRHTHALSFSLTGPPAGPCVMCGRAKAEAAITLLDSNVACARHLAYFCPLLHSELNPVTENASELRPEMESFNDELEYVDSALPVTPTNQSSSSPFETEPQMPFTPKKPSAQSHTASFTQRIAGLRIEASSWQQPLRPLHEAPSPKALTNGIGEDQGSIIDQASPSPSQSNTQPPTTAEAPGGPLTT